MGKATDLTLVQKTIIESLHKEGKKQKVIASRAGCSQSSVSKFLHGKAVGRKKCGRKLATTERDDRSLERIVRSNRFNNLVEISRECQDHWCHRFKSNNPPPTAGDGLPQLYSSDQAPFELPAEAEASLVWSTERKNWMVARWTKVLFMDESKFCVTFGNKGRPRVWRLPREENQPRCTKSSVKFPWCWSGVGQLCFLKFTASPWVFSWCQQERRSSDAPISRFSKTRCQLTVTDQHWGAPLACKFTRPWSNREFVGTGEKENLEGVTKHPRGTQRCHLKSVEICHTWGLLPSSFVHATAHSGSYCSKGCCYQVLTILNCHDSSCFY